MTATPSLRLNNGDLIPQIGYGAFDITGDETTPTVLKALEVGYRSIDTFYGNEDGVGRAVAQSGLPRDDVFIATKLTVADMLSGNVRGAMQKSLERLSLDFVDLYLLHWPAPATDSYLAAWESLEELQREGLTRAIGVCNFGEMELGRVIDLGGTTPAVNQIELHPALRNRDVESVNEKHGIITEAWGPLARGAMLTDPVIAAIAAAHSRSTAQVILRWHLQQGRVLIPKSATESRMRDNLNILDFTLSSEELGAIDELNQNERVGPDPRFKNDD